eukprot:387851-Prymnesium_polylepis.1
MQSLRLVACMSAQRDNSAFPCGGSESSSTTPAGWRRRKQKPECDCVNGSFNIRTKQGGCGASKWDTVHGQTLRCEGL